MTANVRIPLSIQPLLREVVGLLRDVFGQKVRAIYLAGSYAQGCARPESDADFYFVLSGPPTAEETREYGRRCAQLSSRWTPAPVYRIDIACIQNLEASDYATIRRLIIVQLTGRAIYGRPLHIDAVARYPIAGVAAAFREFHVAYIPTLPLYDPVPLVRTFARRALAKYMLRDLEWLAVLSGAPLSCMTAEFAGHVKRYAPEFAADAEICWRLYRQPHITSSELAALQGKQANILKLFINRVDTELAKLDAEPAGTITPALHKQIHPLIPV